MVVNHINTIEVKTFPKLGWKSWQMNIY